MNLIMSSMDDQFILDILMLDSVVYEDIHCGTKESLTSRFEANCESYILAYDGDLLVGYFCFFPVSDAMRNRLFVQGLMFDDNIEAKDIMPYVADGSNHVFVISCVIHPAYQDSNLVVRMQERLALFFKEKIYEGVYITSMSGITVSKDGEKLAKRLGMKSYKMLNVGYTLYSADARDVSEFVGKFTELPETPDKSKTDLVKLFMETPELDLIKKFGYEGLHSAYSIIVGEEAGESTSSNLVAAIVSHIKEEKRREALEKLRRF